MSFTRRAFTFGSLSLGVSSFQCRVSAQTGAIRWIVPFTPGGNTDVVARILAQSVSEQIQRPIIIENIAGAGVLVGSQTAARQAPDGNTFLVTTPSHAIAIALNSHKRFDIENAFEPVALIGWVPLVLVVNPLFPAHTMPEFLDRLREKPGHFNYGTAGRGTGTHLPVLLLEYQAKVSATHVPYRGAGPAMNDVIAGTLSFMIDAISTAAPQAQGGHVRALGVTTVERSQLLPDIPTFRESGLSDYDYSIWNVLLAPRGTPTAIIENMSAAVARALALPELKMRFGQIGTATFKDPSPTNAKAFLDKEIAALRKLRAETGFTID